MLTSSILLTLAILNGPFQGLSAGSISAHEPAPAQSQAGSASPQRTAAEYAARWKAIAGMDRSTILAQDDLNALLLEFAEAGRAYRRDIDDAKAEGRPPRACPPDRIQFSTDDFVAEVDRLPTDEQAKPMPDVFGKILDRRYPCTASA